MAIKDEVFKAITNVPAVTSNRSRFERLRGIEPSPPLPFPPIVNDKSSLALDQTPSKPNTKWTQTEHKVNTNRTQTEHKTEHKLNTNRTQTEHKPNTKWTQSEHDIEHKPNTNRTQTEHKPNTKISFSSCVGIQKNMLVFLYLECKNNRTKISSVLTLEYIAEALKIRAGSVKTSIKRLEEKGALQRVNFKNGRGGWSQYELSDHIYREIMQYETEHKLNTKWTQTEHKLDTKLDTNAPCSSSLKDFKETTTTGEITLPDEWEKLDFTPLQKCGVHFGRQQIITLWPFLKNHSAHDFQESIDAFAYDIEHGHTSARRGNLNLFIGTIRNGQPYLSSHYVSPEREQMKQMLALAEKRRQEQQAAKGIAEDQKFREWLEAPGRKENLLTQISNFSLRIDFEHGGRDGTEWVRRNIYAKERAMPTQEKDAQKTG